MARVPDLIECAKQFDIKMITIEDLIAYRRHHETLVTRGGNYITYRFRYFPRNWLF